VTNYEVTIELIQKYKVLVDCDSESDIEIEIQNNFPENIHESEYVPNSMYFVIDRVRNAP
jgi:hypothetical protein